MRKDTLNKLAVLAILLGVIAFLFRGWLEQGMEMDEVNRACNLIPLFRPEAEPMDQSIFRTEILGREVPIMYKEYISSAFLIKFLPLFLFEDYLVGIRSLHLLYFAVSAGAFFVFLAGRHFYLAAVSSLLIATAPLLYPAVRIGFAQTLHILFLTLFAYFMARFLKQPDRRHLLFFAVFLLCLGVNIIFYTSWVVAGAGLASLLLFPGYWWKILADLKNWPILAAGASLGLFNFVYYNLAAGFPTVNTLYLYVFDREQYNQDPIDWSEALPFTQDLARKLVHLRHSYGPHWEAYLFLLVVVSALFAAGLALSLRQGWWPEYRVYLFPFLAFIFISALILLSPRGTRPGHYVFYIPFEQLSLASATLLASRMIAWRNAKRAVLWSAPMLLLGLNLYSANHLVSEINRSGGRGIFSPSVFDFVEYLEQKNIDSRNVHFLVWGLYAQPYFLNKGEFHINNFVYDFYGRGREEVDFLMKRFLSSVRALPRIGDAVYFPLYEWKQTQIRDSLIHLVDEGGGELRLEAEFPERDGTPNIELYRLENARDFIRSLASGFVDEDSPRGMRIRRWGPQQVTAGREEGQSFWFRVDNLAPTSVAVLDGLTLRSRYASRDLMTARIPAFLLEEPSQSRLLLFDSRRRIRSQWVQLEIVPREEASEAP